MWLSEPKTTCRSKYLSIILVTIGVMMFTLASEQKRVGESHYSSPDPTLFAIGTSLCLDWSGPKFDLEIFKALFSWRPVYSVPLTWAYCKVLTPSTHNTLNYSTATFWRETLSPIREASSRNDVERGRRPFQFASLEILYCSTSIHCHCFSYSGGILWMMHLSTRNRHSSTYLRQRVMHLAFPFQGNGSPSFRLVHYS